MPQLPASSHDWALWLFNHLEEIEECGGVYWQGKLPSQWNFEEITSALPKTLMGVTDRQSRIIEFSPKQGCVFETLDELLQGPWLRSLPHEFTVRGLGYTHNQTETVPQPICNYLEVVRFWKLLKSFADYEVNQAVVYIKSHESKIEIRAEYSAADLVPLINLKEFASVYFETDHHRDQKRNIIRASLIEIGQGQLVVSLSAILSNFEELVDRVKASYSLYTADFSFEKLSSEIDKQNVDDIIKVNKTLADIQNQLLALPIALMLAAAGAKPDAFATNISILIGVAFFTIVMCFLVGNQKNSIDTIEQEVKLRIEKITEQPKNISERVLPLFDNLKDRIERQKRNLNIIHYGIFVVLAVSVIVMSVVQWPNWYTYFITYLMTACS